MQLNLFEKQVHKNSQFIQETNPGVSNQLVNADVGNNAGIGDVVIDDVFNDVIAVVQIRLTNDVLDVQMVLGTSAW